LIFFAEISRKKVSGTDSEAPPVFHRGIRAFQLEKWLQQNKCKIYVISIFKSPKRQWALGLTLNNHVAVSQIKGGKIA
jgi:hypothetical protein